MPVKALDPWAVTQDFISKIKDFRRRAVIRIDVVELRIGVTLGERDNILPVGPAPRVDALCIVAHGHDLMLAGEQVDDATLQTIRILKLID